jgi:hypothetical protein
MSSVQERLPDNFVYKFASDTFNSTENYAAVFYIKDIDNAIDFNDWLEQFKKKSETDWIVNNKGSFKLDGKRPKFTHGNI